MQKMTKEEKLAWWQSRPPSAISDHWIRVMKRLIREDDKQVAEFRAELDALDN